MAQAPNNIQIRQRRSRLVIILAALILLIAAGVYYFLSSAKPEARPVVRPPGTVAVPVIARPLKIGATVNMRDMRLVFYNPLEVPRDALLKPFQFERRVVLRDMRPGEYLTEKDLSEVAAPNTFSGLTRPGMRMVVVEAGNISGSVGYLRQGDRVDVLAIGWSDSQKPANNATSSPFSGTQPGQSRRSPRTPTGVSLGAGAATLVAEAAKVVVAPDPRVRANPYVVLEMPPGDAHTTSLALGSGAVVRLVFRPFNEESRIVEAEPADTSAYPPRDYRRVQVIEGTESKTQTAIFER